MEMEALQLKAAKREQIQASVRAQIEAKYAADEAIADAVRQLRVDKNARQREERRLRELAPSWPHKMRLHAAALAGDVGTARKFLAADTDSSFNVAQLDVNLRWSEDQQTPLHLAAVRGNPEMARARPAPATARAALPWCVRPRRWPRPP
jgi:hypothetical protein